MRWTKIVLIFQAIVTLIIGLTFFFQLLSIDNVELNKIKTESISNSSSMPPTLDLIKQRFTIAAYVLLIVSIIELLIIIRLVE